MDIVGDEGVHNEYGVFLGLNVGQSDHQTPGIGDYRRRHFTARARVASFGATWGGWSVRGVQRGCRRV